MAAAQPGEGARPGTDTGPPRHLRRAARPPGRRLSARASADRGWNRGHADPDCTRHGARRPGNALLARARRAGRLNMSFILDALRKSEHERQRQSEPGIADIRASTGTRSGLPIWALALGCLLLLNVIVVIVLVFRSNSTPEAAPTTTAVPAPTTVAAAPAVAPSTPAPAPTSVSTPTPAPATSEPQQQLPVAAPAQAPQAAPEPAPAEAEPTLRPSAAPVEEAPDESYENLPTLGEVASHGTAIPELHLDLHVYASRPADRFVFLNTRKYREGGKTPEGTTVERITPDGVVLNHHGVRFLLPRQ